MRDTLVSLETTAGKTLVYQKGVKCTQELLKRSYVRLFWRKLEEFVRKTLEKHEKTEETDENQ